MKPAAPPGSKASIRIAALEARSALDEAARAAASRAVAERAKTLVAPGTSVALYAPLRGELDCMPLAALLDRAGHTLALPVVTGRNEALRFRAYRPGDTLISGFGGIMQPCADAAEIDPDFLFVPLAAFDRNLHRLGYGAGFYDRTLAELRSSAAGRTAVGLAFAVQQVGELPIEEHDIALDFVVTEDAVLKAPLLCDCSS